MRAAVGTGRQASAIARGGFGYLLLLVPLLGACGQDQNKSLNLAIACETATCTCTPESGYVAKPPEVKWNTDGTAYCPTGFQLYLPPPKSQRMTVGPGIQ